MANVPEEFDIERKLDIIARDYISKFKRKELGLTFEEDVSDMSSLPKRWRVVSFVRVRGGS